MPILKLRKHQSNFSEEDILINPSDYPDLKLNDVVELTPPNSTNPREKILLQVRKWPDSITYPNSVSIKDSVINCHMRLYSDVLVNIVDKKNVIVDSIELCFSNAYLARSYMWGLRNHLTNRCVYERQKLDHLNTRSQISEIWAHGTKVSSGCLDTDTKIVFRSASSLVYLFIQMSSEMWDYDINGDLYCEKAINGFLTDLFERWRRNDCSHDITIILFSRTYYDAENIEEFPKEMRECLQIDSKNRFYEDCYRVAFQNDRFDLHDWNAKLTQLKSLFNQYQKEVIDRHQDKYDTKIPRAYNSSAAQGNFLEVLNMSLNVFEKHYFDRSFDRTGQLSVVVSPGVGVFEVDFEVTNLTKQRIIDNGIGSDLVCLGEQPLHTVPLLKFNSRSSSPEDSMKTCDVYNMPHWINLSFYSSENQDYYSNFIPRIKLPTIHSGLQEPSRTLSCSGDFRKITNTTSQLKPIAQQQRHESKDELEKQTKEPITEARGSTSSLKDNHTVKNEITGIKPSRPTSANQNNNNNNNPHPRHSSVSFINNHQTPMIPDLIDYDDYDLQVFKPNPLTSQLTFQQQHCQLPSSSLCDRDILSNMDFNSEFVSTNNQTDPCYDDDDVFLDRVDKGQRAIDNNKYSIGQQKRGSDVKNYTIQSNTINKSTSLIASQIPNPNNSDANNGTPQTSNQIVVATNANSTNAMMQPANNTQSNYLSIHAAHQQRISPQIGHTPFTRMSLVDSYYLNNVKMKPESADDLSVRGYNMSQSSRLSRITTKPKALINPFDPSHMTIKLTPNRRRWTHVFPQGPTGTFMQQHHYQQTIQQNNQLQLSENNHTNALSTNNNQISNNLGAMPYLADVGSELSLANNAQFNNTLSNIASGSGINSILNNNNKFRFNNQRKYNILSQNYNPSIQATTTTPLLSGRIKSSSTSTILGNPSGLNQQNNNHGKLMSPTHKSTLVSNETVRFAWCASGEQVWTPAITTGVDWKSLTMPACLPLTTDFFPSKTSLQNDYVIGEYTIDSSCIHPRYTLLEVYRELVCQRLQKGFQIILLSRDSSADAKNRVQSRSHVTRLKNINPNRHLGAGSSSGASTIQHGNRNLQTTHGQKHHQQHHSSSSDKSESLSARRLQQKFSTNNQIQQQQHLHELEDQWIDEQTEYTMSIGRIFHKLKLNQDTITITQYRPRHPYPTIKIDYCYRFRAPFHETYGQSWVHFKSEKLENYSWNYLDNYICARGDNFELRNSLKFWRLRVIVMPSRLNLRKLSRENQASSNESIENDKEITKTSAFNQQQQQQFHDVHYLEYSREECASLMESFAQLLEIINKTRRASTGRLSTSSVASLSSTTVSQQQQSDNNNQTTTTTTTSSTGQLTESSTRLNVILSNNRIKSVDPQQQQQQQDNSHENSAKIQPDNHNNEGNNSNSKLHFESINMDIDSSLRAPERAEWVHVQYHNYYDINQAYEFVIKWMVASGAGIAEMVQGWSRKVGNSSVHVVPIPWEPFALPHTGKADPLRCPLTMKLNLDSLPNESGGCTMDDNQVLNFQEKILRRFGFINFHDLISSEKIDRQFIHLSGFAFVALPNLVNLSASTSLIDQINNESMEDASSSSIDRTSLRNNVNNENDLTNQHNNQTELSDNRLQTSDRQTSRKDCLVVANENSLLLSNPDDKIEPNIAQQVLKTMRSPREEYITRHIGGARQNRTSRLRGELNEIEFIWSWNYMLTKRWRSSSTQDESYAVSLMQDFKRFCMNDSNRLVEFWYEVKNDLL